ncbi:MAG: sulfatase, partial [Planctomycetaceae bacterium]
MRMNRRTFIKMLGLTAASAWKGAAFARAAETERLNILLFTADDLHRDSVSCFGGKVPGLTPNLDSFAAQGVRFENAHVNVAICQPSRGVLATGRYGHNSGITGFMHT